MPTPTVKTTSITVHVNTDQKTMTVDQSPDPGTAGQFKCELQVVGNAAAGVKAYMSLMDHTDLAPDAGTIADSFQNVVFPFRDTNGNELTPIFDTQSDHGSVSVLFSAFLPQQNHPMESVVIVDW